MRIILFTLLIFSNLLTAQKIATVSPNQASYIPIINDFGIKGKVNVFELNNSVTPEQFGAIGDGVTNDSDAFIAMSNYINSNGCKAIILSKKTYLIGKQITGSSYYLTGQDIIGITNCENVDIRGNGAILKIDSTLKFGTFDPITGNPYNPILPFYDATYVASLGNVIRLTECGNVTISNLEINGNSNNIILGGEWGDQGRQIIAYNINLINNKNVVLTNIKSNKSCLDGIKVEDITLNFGLSIKPHLLQNVSCKYNGRNGLTWNAGNNLTVINSEFSHSGQNGFSSSPAAGVDIESESSVVENGTFINSVFGNNKGAGMVSDGGTTKNVSFKDCKFYGTEYFAIYPKNPNFVFNNCLIAGGAVNSYNAANPIDRTKFFNCKFSADEIFNGLNVQYQTQLFDFSSQNPLFDNCVFVTNNSSVALPSSTQNAEYFNCYFKQNGSTTSGNTKGTFHGTNIFDIVTGNNDLSGSIFINSIKDINNKITGVPIYENLSQSDNYDVNTRLSLRGSNGYIWYNTNIYSSYTVPTSGTYKKGDIVLNNYASSGDAWGWYCVTAGSPGTWMSIGNLLP